MSRRYMDWPDSPDEKQGLSGPSMFVDNVVVMPTPHEPTWHGLWAFDADDGHEEFYGDKDAVIAWARSKSTVVRVWSDVLEDLELLTV